MKFTKKCNNTLEKITIRKKWNRRYPSAGMFYTSSAGAVTSLILWLKERKAVPVTSLILKRNILSNVFPIVPISIIVLLSFVNTLFGITGTNQASAITSTITVSVVDSISVNISSVGTTGSFATSDTSTNNISVTTTNGTGYTLGIKASTEGSNALTKSGGGSIPSHTVSAGISESTYRTSSTYNNTWGYRPSKLNSTSNSNYLPGPTSATTPIVLDTTNTANPTTAINYNLAIGTRVNSSTAPGSYTNTFIITAVANPIPYSITYNQNTTDTVTGMPTNISSQTYNETVNISSFIFKNFMKHMYS